jgi:regulatory protein
MQQNKRADLSEIALDKMLKLCSRGEKCIADIREKLQQYNLSTEKTNFIIQYLIVNQFIDEKRYSKAFANDKSKFSKWGKVKIEHALRLKGIESDLINEAIKQISQDNYLLTMKNELEKKRKSIKSDPVIKQKEKLIRFALSRGYQMKDIKNVLKELFVIGE